MNFIGLLQALINKILQLTGSTANVSQLNSPLILTFIHIFLYSNCHLKSISFLVYTVNTICVGLVRKVFIIGGTSIFADFSGINNG
tara:strand:+ start:328 stop:585 length:258 start_codon:yes stop_codon:yes gene_type:complete